MPDSKALDKRYRALSDEELLKLAVEGGFTAEAEQALGKELARRNLTLDEAKRHFAPKWLDKADVGTLGVLTLANGERITAQIVGLNEEGDRLSVQVIPSEGFTRKGLRTHRSHRYVPLHRIASFEPRPHLMEQWPFSDPCRHKSSGSRLLLMSAIFLCMTVGSMLLVVLLRGMPYGLQVVSLVFYTFFVLFFTFATTGSRGGGNVPGYKFTCPAVEPQIPRLLWRHLICLVALFALETAALALHPHLRDWWNIQDKKGSTPFEIALMFLGIGLAMAQILTNKSLLNRAHREFSG
jgi:VIT1/CCC1 family predicted Fe2+/Mn2+ transporter